MVCPRGSSDECSYPMTGQGTPSQFVHMIPHKVLGYSWRGQLVSMWWAPQLGKHWQPCLLGLRLQL